VEEVVEEAVEEEAVVEAVVEEEGEVVLHDLLDPATRDFLIAATPCYGEYSSRDETCKGCPLRADCSATKAAKAAVAAKRKAAREAEEARKEAERAARPEWADLATQWAQAKDGLEMQPETVLGVNPAEAGAPPCAVTGRPASVWVGGSGALCEEVFRWVKANIRPDLAEPRQG
jgi:hypothetical protein